MSAPTSRARLLLGLHGDGRPLALDEHWEIHGRLPASVCDASPSLDLLGMVESSGLRGRGGASFPTSAKLEAVTAERGRPVVVANACEGEPASAKDHVLITRTPNLVLDGAAVAAAAIGADRVIVATHGAAAGPLRAAIASRTAVGADRIEPTVATVPDRFISGQETALVNFLNGGPGLPTFVPPRPSQRGVDGQPTLVSNVETLAHLALIARYGPDWFRSVGTATEPGTTLVTMQGAVRRPGVYEIARGDRLVDLFPRAGGLTEPIQALLIGGYAGTWLYADEPDIRLSDAALSAAGASLGAGIIVALAARDCGIATTSRLLTYLSDQSAGQCGPCVHGLAAMAGSMHELSEGRAPRDVVERLESWAWQVTGRGACRHPDGAARLAASALQVFEADIADHKQGRACRGAASPQAGGVPPRTAARISSR
jgi:NADH:ubiquinone oxidoreductase subunit F (NADH-binding)